MDIFTTIYLDVKSLRPASSQTKFKKKRFKETCWIEQDKHRVFVNLNKNKNWETMNYLRKCIKNDPEYGEIKAEKVTNNFKNYKTLTISVNKPGTNEVVRYYYFSKEHIPNRNDKAYYKREFKFAHITFKKNYDDHIRKTLKTKAKRKIKLDQDFLIYKNNKPSQNANKFLNMIVTDLKNIIESIKRDKLSFKTFEDPICSQPKNFFYSHQDKNNYSFRQVISNSDCSICYKNSELKLVLISCNHGCCKSCWQNYALFSKEFRCCFNNCDEKLELDFLKLILPKITFKQHLKYVTETNYLKCPNKCGNYFEKSCSYKFPRCICGNSFCIECQSESHFPIKCETYQFYLNFLNQIKQNNSSYETVVKGKFCPSCKIFIEKNGGCMYMRCICGVQFCWNCLQKVSTEHSDCYILDDFTMSLTDWEQKIIKPLIDHYDYCSSIGTRLITNLNKKVNLIIDIVNNKNSTRLCDLIVKHFGIERKKFKNFIEQVIQFSFDLIEKVNRLIEFIFSEACFLKKNKLIQNKKAINLQKKMILICENFNKILSRKTTLGKLNKIVNLDLEIISTLNKFKNESFKLI